MPNATIRSVSSVAAFGAIGGGLGWLLAAWMGQPMRLGTLGDVSLAIAVGAVASVVFVYVIANADRSDAVRPVALALVVGLLWTPAWDAGGALVERFRQRSAEHQAMDALRAATELARSATPSSEQPGAHGNELRSALRRLRRAVDAIDSLAARERVGVELRPLLSLSVSLDLPEVEALAAALDPAGRLASGDSQASRAEARLLVDALQDVRNEIESMREEAQRAQSRVRRAQSRVTARLDKGMATLVQTLATMQTVPAAAAHAVPAAAVRVSAGGSRAEVKELESELILALADAEAARAEAEAARAEIETARTEADAALTDCQ